MQPFEKFELALGVFWSLVTLYFAIGVLPGVWRRQQQWEAKAKRGGGKIASPSRLQRLIFVLLAGLMSAEVLAGAFHRGLGKMTGIGSGAICCLMMILPALYFSVGMVEKRLKCRQRPGA